MNFSVATSAAALPSRVLAVSAALGGAGCVLLLALGVSVPVALAAIPAVVAAIVDLRTGRVPNRLVLLAALPVLIAAVGAAASGTPSVPGRIAVGAVALGTPLLAAHLLAPSSLGFGDVKLGGALGAALGAIDARLALLALAIAAALTLVAAATFRRSVLPFAPGLVLGSFVAAAVGERWAAALGPAFGVSALGVSVLGVTVLGVTA